MAPRTPLFLFLAAVLLLWRPAPIASANPVAFSFPSFSLRNLSLLGWASLRATSVSLPPPSSQAFFPLPLPFLRNASFSTSFVFASPSATKPSSRLSFVLLPDPLAAAEDLDAKNRSLPLEVAFDASNNRVSASSAGVDVAGNSTGAVDLRNGNEVGSWVVYDAPRVRLEVFVSHASLRPPTPALVGNTNSLAVHFAEFMFIGFEVTSSSSNGSSDGGFLIQSWSFQTSGLPAVDPASRSSRNISDSVRSAPPLGGLAGRKHGRHRRLAFELGIPSPIVFLCAVMVFVLMFLKKWRSGFKEGLGAKAADEPRRGKVLDAVDPTLNGEYDAGQMMRFLLVGLSCVNPFSEERPIMRTVLDMLEGNNELLPVPRKKPLLVFVPNAPIDLEGIVSECNQSTVSSDLYELKIDIN
ncbi:hypothetical protein ABZP36_036030 [Zizania latifolia]